ncbi:MAG: transcriptional regulator [Spirochaetales bacterium]|nr:transcriptional regulator [Spirochaetales bacterium]
MKKAFIKSERLNRIQLILVNSPLGVTRTDLAKKLGVSRATITRDIADLSINCAIKEDEVSHKLTLDSLSFLSNMNLTAEEIEALHLATRLLGCKVRFNYPAASSALRKFGEALKDYALPVAREISNTAELFESHSSFNNNEYSEIIKTITSGIVQGRSVSFDHYSRKDKKWKSHLFSCYCIEPYAEGNSLYLIGFDEDAGELREIKFELIKNVCLTDKTYSISDDFSANEFFKHCWGIWTSVSSPVCVELIFSADVKERVLQTEWHNSESTEPLPDGRLRWFANIAEPREMLPWIRGWGSSVEVIKPEWLRSGIVAEVKKMNRLYADDLC